MQYINHWPDISELALPEPLTQDLHQQLLQPFDSEASAKEFWGKTSSTIILLEPAENITQLQENDVYSEIDFALTYPEYTLPLKNGYLLLMAIVNDSGSGIYLVIPPDLSHLINLKSTQ